jgi:uncharacterized membrane protein (UPF0182 family)
VGDLFDEFMRELRRRQAEATRRSGRPHARRSDGRGDADPGDDRDDAATGPMATDDDNGDPEGAADHDEPTDDDEVRPEDREPRPIRPLTGVGGRGGFGGRTGRRVGGPDDGGTSLGVRLSRYVAVGIFLFLVLMLVVGVQLWTDAIWYRSVGYDAVFWTRIGVQVGLFVLGLVLALVVLLGNVWLAGRLVPPVDGRGGGTIRGWLDRLNEAAANAERSRPRGPWDPWGGGPGQRGQREPVAVSPEELPDPTPVGRLVIVVVAILAALTIAGSVSGAWETLLLWIHRVPFDPSGTVVRDPVFGKDISFFLFDLPFLRFVQSLAVALLTGSLVVTGARYVVAALAGAGAFDTRIRVHLALLAGLVIMAIALGYQLDKLDLVHSNRGVATGVSYTDENAQFLAYDVLTGLSAIAAALLVGGAFARVLWPLAITLAVWFIASIAVGRIYPEFVQRVTVIPNQQALESKYILNNIAMTRLAYALNAWQDRPYRGDAPLTPAAVSSDSETFANARLWDYRPLNNTLDQLQTVLQYYDFVDVDTDRYQIDGQLRQVMLSARELALDKNPNATGWVNTRLVYTHGMGAAMVPVSAVGSQGQPSLIISNLPPVSTGGAPQITQPRIYFGERPSSYVIVGAQQDEFDYQRGAADQGGDAGVVATRWTGTTGIPLSTTLDRVLFAIRFRDFDMLISNQITNQSQLLMNRDLGDRLPLIAPFLRYDKDPYVVIDGAGRLKYVQDAYTTTDQFPNAQAFHPADLPAGNAPTGFGDQPFDYVRNSVKVVMDAYDGTTTFYVADPSDPLIRAWEGVFPTLFRPISELPADLKPHLRVPEELFDIQTRVFGRYHVADPATFYSNNDLWTVPTAQTNEQSLPNEAYYVFMRMPGADNAEFLLLQPMIRANRPNMIAWVAARNGPANYGQTTVFRFPSETTVFGPAQVEAQIDIDPDISAQITLWNQSGSQVVRGNLIVLPVGDSLIYLQPVYLQSKSAKFPAFERIVVASSSHVVWGSTLSEALSRFLAEEAAGPGGGPTPSPSPTPSPGPGGSPAPSAGPGGSPGPVATPPTGDVRALIDYANAHFEAAQAALRNGEFARYGTEIELVRQALERLQALTGASAPLPSASAAP